MVKASQLHGAASEAAPKDLENTGLGRRQFLASSAAGIVGAFALSAVPADASPAGERTVESTVSIGYWTGSDSALSGAAPRKISALVAGAMGIPADRALVQTGAVLTLHGLFGSPLSPATDAVQVRALFTVPTAAGEQTVPFEAWSYHSGGGVASRSHPVRFLLPVHAGKGLRLAIVHRVHTGPAGTPGALQSREHDCSLSHLADGDVASLRSGVYFFAIGAPSSSHTPHWRGCAFLPDEEAGGERRLYRRTLKGIKPVDFSYLVASVVPTGSDLRVTL